MALREKITQDDLIFYEIIRHPVLFGEFINNVDKLEREEPFELDIYQKEIICDFNNYVSIIAGRAVGKTVSLVLIILWVLVNKIYPEDYIVYTVPNKVHLEPVFVGLTRQLRSNSFLKHYIEPKKGINSSSYTITLLNRSQLLCRIAGTSGTGANVIGLHSPCEFADELGYYPWGTWLELQPTHNTWTEGFRVMGSGVPTGLRENNVLYHIDQENNNFSKHRISAYENPRFTEEDEERAIEQFGGRESEDFVHFVLGEHGSPVFSVFDRRLFNLVSYPIYKLTIDGTKMKNNLSEYIKKVNLLPKIPNNNGIIIGADLGYTDPTAIIVLYLTPSTDQIKFHARIQLNKVPYPIQTKLLDLLDTRFKPIIWGMDAGHAGVDVIQTLSLDDTYLHKDYENRLIPIKFGSWISLGIDQDGSEIKTKVKPFSISILQDYSNNHRIIYSHTDLDMITELERMTFTRNPNGDIIYNTLTPKGGKRGADHFTSALLCAIMSFYLEREFVEYNRKPKKLMKAKWL